MKKRLTSFLLALAVILTFVPTHAIATDLNENNALYKSPTVTELLLSYEENGDLKSVSLLPMDTEQPQIALSNGTFPIFKVKFDNNSRLNRVYITSTKGDDTKYLEAIYDQEEEMYITSGLFDPSDTSYVPGIIGVTFDKKTTSVTDGTIIDDIDLTILKEQIKEQIASMESTSMGADGSINGRIVLRDMFGAAGDVYVDASISTFIQGSGIDKSELHEWLGIYKDLGSMTYRELKGENGKDYTLYFDLTDTTTYLAIVKDVTENKYTKMLIQKAADELALGDVSIQLSQTNIVTKALLDYTAITTEMSELRENITANDNMTLTQKLEAMDKIDDLENDKLLFMIGTTTLPLFIGIGAAAGPAGLLFSALLAGITATSDYFWQNRIAMIQGCTSIENVFSENNHPGWKNPEMITAQRGRITESGNYFLSENLGVLTIYRDTKVRLCLHGHFVNSLVMESGATLCIQDCKYMEHDDGTVTGGIIGETISMPGKNELTFESGIIQSGSIASNGTYGKITINGGWIGGNVLDSGGYGQIEINGGTLKYNITTNNSSLIINNGIINGDIRKNSYISGYVDNSSYQIHGGAITGSLHTDGRISVNMKKGNIWGDIKGGTVIFQTGTCAGAVSGKNVTILGGEIQGKVSGTNVTIEDGLILGGATFSTDTTAVINGGTIRGGISNYRDSNLTIHGGVIYDGIYNSNIARLKITNGSIYGGIESYSSSVVTLLIQDNTNIQVSGTTALNKTPLVNVADGYAGNVVYYNSEGVQGETMTIEEATEAIAVAVSSGQPYVRLKADSVHGTLGTNDELRWSYNHTSNQVSVTGFVSDVGSIYMVSYNKDGKLLSVSKATDSNRQTSIPNNAALIKLFWLNSGFLPICENIIIERS